MNSMITAADVYLVMTVGNVRELLLVFSIIASVASLVVVAALAITKVDNDDDAAATGMKLLKKLVPLTVVLSFLVAVIPSTKTLAAMYILPALTSQQVLDPLSTEAKELYDLLKAALREELAPAKQDDK